MNKKFLSIISVFLFFILILTGSVFADFDDVTHSFDRDDLINWASSFDEYNSGKYYYYIVDKANTPNSSSTCYIEFIDKEYFNNNNIKAYLSYENGYYYINYSEPALTCISWNGRNGLYQDLAYRTKSTCGFAPESVTDNIANLTFTTDLAIIYKDSTFESFFLVAPQTLKEIMEVEGVQKTIPKGILGLVPLIIVVVVSFLGLRKALKMLSTLLHRCLSL